MPADYRELAVLAARWHGLVHRALELRPRTVLRAAGVLRRLPAAGAIPRTAGCLRGRSPRARRIRDRPYPQADRLREAQSKTAAVSLSEADREGLAGEKIGELLRRRRLAALKAACQAKSQNRTAATAKR